MIKLSKRLNAISELVTKGHNVIDVGCDHGYVPIALVQNKAAVCAVASDVRKGPLSRAEQHVKEQHLEHRIRLAHADGIPKDFPALFASMEDGADRAVTCIIAGMGGMLMAGILTDAGALLENIDEFVLSPQSDLAYFRKTLSDLGLCIKEEAFLEEDGKFYTILRCTHADGAIPPMTDTELLFGKTLLEERNPVLETYLKKRERTLEQIRSRLLLHGYGAEDKRMAEVEAEERKVREALHYFTSQKEAAYEAG